jgi:hypothetical protein
MKFGAGVLCRKLLSKREFCDTRRSDSRTLVSAPHCPFWVKLGAGSLQIALLTGAGSLQTALLTGAGSLQTALLTGASSLQIALLTGAGSLQTALLTA